MSLASLADKKSQMTRAKLLLLTAYLLTTFAIARSAHAAEKSDEAPGEKPAKVEKFVPIVSEPWPESSSDDDDRDAKKPSFSSKPSSKDDDDD